MVGLWFRSRRRGLCSHHQLPPCQGYPRFRRQVLWQEPSRGCQAPAQRPGPIHRARGPILRPRSTLPTPQPHPSAWYQRLLLRTQARGAPAIRHLQLLTYRQGNPSAHGVSQHSPIWTHCSGPRVCSQLQRVACDVRHGRSRILQLNVIVETS